jgi:hypothetical protein
MFRDIENYSKYILRDKKNNKRGASESIFSPHKKQKRKGKEKKDHFLKIPKLEA